MKEFSKPATYYKFFSGNLFSNKVCYGVSKSAELYNLFLRDIKNADVPGELIWLDFYNVKLSHEW